MIKRTLTSKEDGQEHETAPYLSWTDAAEIIEWIRAHVGKGAAVGHHHPDERGPFVISVFTPEGIVRAHIGDLIVRGPDRTVLVVKSGDIFTHYERYAA